MVCKIVDQFFYNNMEKVRAELAESARVTSDVAFVVCTLINNSYEPKSAREI